jgi:hypothetical protein
MRLPLRVSSLAALLAACALSATTAQAQGGFLERAKKKAKEKLEQEIDKKTAETPASTATPAASSGEGATAKPAVSKAAASDEAEAPAPKVNSGADFTPGTRVIFATDFARDEIGDFPR